MKRTTNANDLSELTKPLSDLPEKYRLNGHSHRSRSPLRSRRRRDRGRQPRLTDAEIEFAKAGLEEMNRLVEEAMQMDERQDELQPRFKVAAMQKAWFVVALYVIGTLGLLVSIFWSGATAILIRVGIAAFLLSLYFAPVHYFVRGHLRANAKLVHDLDKKSLAHAKKAAKLGQILNKRLRRKLGAAR